MAQGTQLKLKIQLLCGDAIAMGPGKADLLDAIAATGSISAAARAMGMSYRRAWLLVDEMNRCWQEPLVATFPGRGKGGGANVTPRGQTVLAWFRTLQAGLQATAGDAAFTTIRAMLRPAPLPARNAV